MIGRVLAVILVLAVAAPAGAQQIDEPPAPPRETSDASAIAAALQQVRDGSTIELSTVGRTTGRVHTRTIWYAVDQGTIWVQSGKGGRTDWYRNVQKNPGVTVRAPKFTFRGTARPVTDPAEVDRVRKLFLEKYTSAWLLSFVGSELGQGMPVAITPDTVTPRGE